VDWLQIRPIGPYFSSFSTNSYSYYSQKSQKLISNGQIFASARIVRQTASESQVHYNKKAEMRYRIPALTFSAGMENLANNLGTGEN